MPIRPRVALATCAELPDGDADDRLVLDPLDALGVDAGFAVWDDQAVDWAAFDLVVVRSTWDYPRRRAEFLAWAATVPRLANPATLLTWNTDKSYLRDLAAGGVPVVPTTIVRPGEDPADAIADDRHERIVVKPAVGAGSIGAGAYGRHERDKAVAHAADLLAAGGAVVVQPYQAGIDTAGETAVMVFDGRISHAARKAPILRGPAADVDGLFVPEQMSPAVVTEPQRAIVDAVLAALPATPLYARVDLIPGADGAPRLLEAELCEPSLFLGLGDASAPRWADAIAGAVQRVRSGA